jgi:hypothetical protein
MPLMDGIPPEYDAWLRLEPRCRSDDFSRGLEARTADPLWMLARQWQTGEFEGEDAGSPLEVELGYSTQSLDRVSLGKSGEIHELAGRSLEMMAERERPGLDPRTRVQIGQQFERFVRSELQDDDRAWVQTVVRAYRDHYPLVLPDGDEWTQTDRATRRFLEFMRGRVVDGEPLLLDLDYSDEDAHLVPTLGGIAEETLQSALQKLKEWSILASIQPSDRFLVEIVLESLRERFEFHMLLSMGRLPPRARHSFEDLKIAVSPDGQLTIAQQGEYRWRVYDAPRAQIYNLEPDNGKFSVFHWGFHESDPAAWRNEQLDYRFEVNPSPAEGQPERTQLIAPSYRNGDLDWYTFNAAGGLQGSWRRHPDPDQEPIKTHPARIAVGGTSPRWWAFEDAATDFGRLDVATPDLAKLILMEYVLIYGDDWFSVPLPVQMPGLVKIDKLRIKNVFGEYFPKGNEQEDEPGLQSAREKVREAISNANRDPDEPMLRWELFTLSPVPDLKKPGVGDHPDSPGIGDVLLIPPVAGYREESPPIEEVLFLRDEGANMVWAVECTVPNGLGRPVDGAGVQRERDDRQRERLENRLAEIKGQLAAGDLSNDKRAELEAEAQEKREELTRLREGPRPSSGDAPRYRLATTVPAHWIPFIPTNATAYLVDYAGMRLRRAQMLRNTDDEEPSPIPAMSRLLELDTDPLLWLEEAAVPRSGLCVQLTAQRLRWVDGKTYVWLGRKVLTGRGEGSSGLRFDMLAQRQQN